MISVLVADDQDLVRVGLRTLIESEEGMRVAGEAADGLSAVALAASERPDVVLMDVRMPGIDGLEATRRIAADPALAGTRIVVLTTFELDEYVFDALRYGASGFLLKDITPAHLRNAILTVHAGNAVLAPDDLQKLLGGEFRAREAVPAAYAALTDKERQIVQLVARGLSNAEIGEVIFVSESTVKTHVGAILRKLGLRDRVQVVVFAHKHGLLDRRH